MNGIIIDTSLFVAAERDQYDLFAFFQKHEGTPLAVSAITISELWHGVERAPPSQRNMKEETLEGLLEHVKIFDFTEEVALTHAPLWVTLEKAGVRIGSHDMIIAATALHHKMHLATFNTKEFNRVAGLKLITL